MEKITMSELVGYAKNLDMETLRETVYGVGYLELVGMELFLNSRQNWVITEVKKELDLAVKKAKQKATDKLSKYDIIQAHYIGSHEKQ